MIKDLLQIKGCMHTEHHHSEICAGEEADKNVIMVKLEDTLYAA